MDKFQIISLVLGSAAIGALVSSLTTLIGQVIERKHQKRTMLLQAAVDLAKTWFARISVGDPRGRGVPEIVLVADFYQMLREVFETGNFSEENRARIQRTLEKETSKTAGKSPT